ncbi:MAG: pentapeptide repeat-containing protein [Gloeomargarita sp. SKYBB_i_bin120]|nr:pentapeptide repeat-containing protein [Gloeomargarita sp. SKYG98]MCS7291765.1 pentapeptide repeat-containing protein [Gloeomargarita sp. SKYB120]MDW8177325.1 pentapeptide repeat-containing protein [Gloeomargarita sp. SKYBB_i_bin120]
MVRGWLIGELSSQAGVSPQTIRFYEREGLLAPPERNKSGYRLYPPESLTRLWFIQHCKQFGLSLEDIKQLVQLQAQGIDPCGSFRRLVKERLAMLSQQMQQLQATHQAISQRLEWLLTRLPETDRRMNGSRTLTQWLAEAANPTPVPPSPTPATSNREQLLQRYGAGERNFQGWDLLQVNLAGVNLSGVDLSRAHLMLANLAEVVLENSRLIGANLTGADAIGGYFRHSQMIGAVMIGTDLSEADLMAANLVGANLGGANLTAANLQEANLSEALLIGANLREANLMGASLWGANLSGADLTGARLDPNSLSTANLWGATLPSGELYPPSLEMP